MSRSSFAVVTCVALAAALCSCSAASGSRGSVEDGVAPEPSGGSVALAGVGGPMLVLRERSADGWRDACAAVAIAERVALTAGHCLVGRETAQLGVASAPGAEPDVVQWRRWAPGHAINEFAVGHDLGLVGLSVPAAEWLPIVSELPAEGRLPVWRDDDLVEVDLPEADGRSCMRVFGPDVFDKRAMGCFGDVELVEGEWVQPGDSGAPLLDGSGAVAGVMSMQWLDRRPGGPVIVAPLKQDLEWIETELRSVN